jgi:hypothetical protein
MKWQWGALSIFIFILILLWALQFWKGYQYNDQRGYEQAQKHLKKRISLNQLQVKTGDLILFSKQNRTGMACYFNNSLFTHVGLVYQDQNDHEFYVLESNITKATDRIQAKLFERINWYQKHAITNNDILNKVAIRRLNRPLESWQYEFLTNAVEKISPVIHTDSWLDRNEQAGLDSMVDRVNTYLPKSYDCLMTHVFNENLPIDPTTPMLCTDFVAHLLQEAFVLRREIHGCIFVEWFQAHKINDYMLYPNDYWYQDELVEIEPTL